jgi:hypothetical protein
MLFVRFLLCCSFGSLATLLSTVYVKAFDTTWLFAKSKEGWSALDTAWLLLVFFFLQAVLVYKFVGNLWNKINMHHLSSDCCKSSCKAFRVMNFRLICISGYYTYPYNLQLLRRRMVARWWRASCSWGSPHHICLPVLGSTGGDSSGPDSSSPTGGCSCSSPQLELHHAWLVDFGPVDHQAAPSARCHPATHLLRVSAGDLTANIASRSTSQLNFLYGMWRTFLY